MKSPLQKSPIPNSRVFVVKSLEDPYFDPNWHFHPEFQLFVVEQGSGTRFVGDNIQRFKAGDLVFTGPNLPHLWRSDPEYFDGRQELITRGIVIYFHEDFLGDPLLKKNELYEIRQLLARAGRGMRIVGKTARNVHRLMNELLALRDFRSVLQLLEILDILANSTELEFLASDTYCNSLKKSDTDRMNRVYDFIMEHFTRKISLEEVASLTYMTPSSFSRFFKSHTNKTFSQLLSEVRIGHASKLLIDQDMGVAEACFKSGFQTLSNFNRQFKGIHRLSPTEYKKAYLNL
ncbi:MAG: AraC family transcriptional regulator [Saprospiraceae bacterium]